MQPFSRALLTGALITGLLNMPAVAAEKPVGVVLLSESGHLDKAVAVAGVDVYSGDGLYTDEGGTLRVKIGASQVYLLSLSSGSFQHTEKVTQGRLNSGTMGFSATPTDPVEIATNIATVRPADGDRAYGQVTITGPMAMTVSAYRGSLLVTGGAGQEQLVREGQTYNVAATPDPESAPPAGGSPSFPSYHTGTLRLVFTIAVMGGAALTAGFLYHHFENESDSTPPKP